jgi:hypothetical protein
VTLIAPPADPESVAAILDRHGRSAAPIDNPSVRRVLLAGEWQYLTTRGHCDCGTALAPRHLESAEDFERRLAERASKLARKGWSPGKIARALDDRRRAGSRPDGGGVDSLELWASVIADLKAIRLPYVGLFVRFYSGTIADEVFAASRRDVPASVPVLEALASLQHDEVTLFR